MRAPYVIHVVEPPSRTTTHIHPLPQHHFSTTPRLSSTTTHIRPRHKDNSTGHLSRGSIPLFILRFGCRSYEVAVCGLPWRYALHLSLWVPSCRGRVGAGLGYLSQGLSWGSSYSVRLLVPNHITSLPASGARTDLKARTSILFHSVSQVSLCLAWKGEKCVLLSLSIMHCGCGVSHCLRRSGFSTSR